MRHEKFKSEAYTKEYKTLEDWMEYVNPCNIQNIDGRLTCVGYPKGSRGNRLCCTKTAEKSACGIFNEHCKYHDPDKGCTVDSLSCSLWFCPDAWNHMFSTVPTGILMNFMQILQNTHQTIRLHFIPAKPRTSKEENFKYANEIFK